MAPVEEGGLLADVMCVSVLAGTGGIGCGECGRTSWTLTGETEVTEPVRVSVGRSVLGMNVVFTEPVVFHRSCVWCTYSSGCFSGS